MAYTYQIRSLKVFRTTYWDYLKEAQSDIYSVENIANPEELDRFENAAVYFALNKDKVIGFSIFIPCKEPRSDYFYGTNLWLYVSPKYRNGIVPARLISGTEMWCKRQGLSYFKWDVNVDSPMIKALNKRKEYKKESIIYSKKLV